MPNGGHYPAYKCDNCGRVYDKDEGFAEALHWHQEPGSVVPHGQCECGGYIYEIDSPTRRFIKRHLESAAEEREALKEMEEQTNAVVQSEFAARAFDGLMRLFSEEQREEFAATGCITIHVRPGLPPVKKMPFLKVDYDYLERRIIEEVIKKDGNPHAVLKEFVPNFKVTKEQLEVAAKEKPSLVELLEKQVSEQALEEFNRMMHHEINMQRRDWKASTFGERYGTPDYLKALPWLAEMAKKEKP